MTALVELRTAIVDAIKVAFPDLKGVTAHGGRFDLPELKRISLKAPAVRIAILGVPKTENVNDETLDTNLRCAAFIVTRDARDLPRDEAALNLAQGLMLLINFNQWALTSVHPATNVKAENLFSGPVDKKGVALWAVTWSQTVQLGTGVFDEEGVMLWQLYISENGDEPVLLFETDPPEGE